MGEDFDYAEEFKTLDLDAVKGDIDAGHDDSQDWWPADYGHYGPLFIRMAWHSAGTYRISDGRGGGGAGQQRFAPLNSWPDNGNLDKARRLLWPVKQKYGRKISWADLMVLDRQCRARVDGLQDLRLRRRPRRLWEPEDVYWGSRTTGSATSATAATATRQAARRRPDGPHLRQPGGPERQPRPARRRPDIRETFARMAMNDEETVALIAGGHTFGKTHGARRPPSYVGPSPRAPDRSSRASAGEQLRHRQGRATPSPAVSKAPGRRRRPSGTTASSRPVRLRVGADEEPGRRAPVDAEGRRRREHRARRARPVEAHAP